MKLHNTHVKQVKTINASWKENQGIMSWKELPRENCKLLPDQGLKLLRKSLSLYMQFSTQHCISAGRSFNQTQFSFLPLCNESQFFPALSYGPLSPMPRVGALPLMSRGVSPSMLGTEIHISYTQHFLTSVMETGNFKEHWVLCVLDWTGNNEHN